MKHATRWLGRNRGFLALMLTIGLVRTAVADYNPVPTGSMHPTILEGDVVLVNRLAYALKLPLTDIELLRLGEPQRGDVVTFSSPRDGIRLIKRVIGLPGDTVALRDKRLILNGQAVAYDEPQMAEENLGHGRSLSALQATERIGDRAYAVQWLPGMTRTAEFGPVTVPPGHYLMLGDNRDNSADSRYIGFVPRERLIGRADRILASADITGNWLPRWQRFGQSLDN